MTLLPDSPPCRDAIENMVKSVNLAYSAFLGAHPEFKVKKPASLRTRIPTPAIVVIVPTVSRSCASPCAATGVGERYSQ
jgi:hypothetical protein